MPSSSQRESFPFEPKSRKRPNAKEDSSNAASSPKLMSSEVKASRKRVKAADKSTSPSESAGKFAPKNADTGIPEVVSRRMIRRMAVFAGVPTALGMSSFVIAYLLLTQHIVEFPNVLVLLVSLGFFGLGTIGLSYGVLSASWQEDEPGSLLGFAEFSLNFRRLVQGLRKQPSTSD